MCLVTIEAAPAHTTEFDRRTEARLPPSPNLTCDACSTHNQSAKIIDVSSQGIGLVLRTRPSPGTMLLLDMRDRTARRSSMRLAKVAYSRRLEDGTWHVGACFLQALPDEDLRMLTGPLLGVTESDSFFIADLLSHA